MVAVPFPPIQAKGRSARALMAEAGALRQRIEATESAPLARGDRQSEARALLLQLPGLCARLRATPGQAVARQERQIAEAGGRLLRAIWPRRRGRPSGVDWASLARTGLTGQGAAQSPEIIAALVGADKGKGATLGFVFCCPWGCDAGLHFHGAGDDPSAVEVLKMGGERCSHCRAADAPGAYRLVPFLPTEPGRSATP